MQSGRATPCAVPPRLARLIELGRLRLGSQLRRQVLAATVRLSLGTVQKALPNFASRLDLA
jgi:DNA-binding GntR family transcriptional regulator